MRSSNAWKNFKLRLLPSPSFLANFAKMSQKITENLMSSLAPSCPRGKDYGLAEKDFAEYKSVIDDRLTELSSQVSSRIISHHSNLDEIEMLTAAIVLRGQHSSSSIWTTEASLRLSNDIFQAISSFYESSHSHSVFDNAKIIKSVLSLLRPKLLADTFRCNPAAVTCYGWFLKSMKCSILGSFLQDLLPTALILADDYEPRNINLGLESIHHIIENITIEKLQWYGHDEVIMDVLKKCLYLREPDVVSSHLKCFISLMYSSLRHNRSLKRVNFDELINNILVLMFMEQKLNLRRIYISNMSELMDARGLGVVRHLTLIFKILSEYALESSTTSDALKALAKTVQVCWYRGDSVGESVLVMLMKVLIASSRTPSQIKFIDVSSEVHNLAGLLNDAFPTVVKQFLDDLRKNQASLDENILSLVNDVFMSERFHEALLS